MPLQVVKLSKILPSEPFGGVALATEVLGIEGGVREEFKGQVIELPPGARFSPHTHISAHIILVIHGRGSITIWDRHAPDQDDRGEVYPLEQGDLFCVPKGVRHAMAAAEDSSVRELIINIPGIPLHDHDRILWET